MKDKVSVLLLCMNHEQYMAQCIQSIANQTHKNLEVIFLDNASSDRSAEVFLSEIKKHGISFKQILNKESRPITVNLNAMLELAEGEFVTPFSTDDWMVAENLAVKTKVLNQDKNLGAVLGNGYYFIEDTNEILENPTDKLEDNITTNHLLLKPKSYFWCGPLYRTELVKKLNGWDENLTVEDLDMNIRISQNYKILQLKQPLVYYRRHSNSFAKNFDRMYDGFKLYYKKYRNRPEIPIKRWFLNAHIDIAKSLEATDRKKSRKYYQKAFFLSPSRTSLKNWIISF